MLSSYPLFSFIEDKLYIIFFPPYIEKGGKSRSVPPYINRGEHFDFSFKI
jgi:hypothetical protein